MCRDASGNLSSEREDVIDNFLVAIGGENVPDFLLRYQSLTQECKKNDLPIVKFKGGHTQAIVKVNIHNRFKIKGQSFCSPTPDRNPDGVCIGSSP